MHKFLVSIVATTDRDKFYLSLVVVVAIKYRPQFALFWYVVLDRMSHRYQVPVL